MEIEKKVKNLVAKLHPLERKVLPVLAKEINFSQIVEKSGLQGVEVMRALQWLENKEVLKIISEKKKRVSLDANGKKYSEEGLPERRFLEALSEDFLNLSAVAKKSHLDKEELNACLGLLKRKLAIDIQKEEELMVKLGPQGKILLDKKTPEEDFLNKKFPLDFDSVTDLDKLALDNLLQRKGFVKVEEVKDVSVELTPFGKELVKADLGEDVMGKLTAGLLKTGKWKDKKFREYDVEINVPQINGGKKHFVNEAVDYIKNIWLEMGFQEMKGNYVQSAFWDLDALFVPQDHPAREMQDTFYLSGKAKLPPLWNKVKEVHKTGGETGSKGWGNFSREETEQLLLRTHTTVLSARTISELKEEDLPAKFFAVGKVFRNEALDWKHLFEFYQVEGIVIDPNANLKHLKGYLREFYNKMGFEKVRMRPAHFPYTEPSVEVDVYHPVKKEWVELGGAGIFRPEVVKPLLGFDCPVLAWGQGMGRIISEYWKITDIRDLYKNDLKQLREMKVWLK
ncbi:phenylalanine--tRNA ligase subunit alpha [Candidatus Woesearchaeota archaeon]|nr:phenylalanine--tRNA ligase subunit alpha [Candidatus Woesearchaeota archaeon]